MANRTTSRSAFPPAGASLRFRLEPTWSSKCNSSHATRTQRRLFVDAGRRAGARGRRTGVSAPHNSASGRERSSATTRLRGLRIHEDEALLHERLLIIEDHAVQVDERLRIDKNADVVELKDAVAFARLRVETDVVAQA